jgi:hypothetical protein
MHRPEIDPAHHLQAPDTVPMPDGDGVARAPRVDVHMPGGARSEVVLPPLLSEAQLQAWTRLRRMRGPGEQRAVLLALVRTPGSARELQAWAEECQGVQMAAESRAWVDGLPDTARLSALEAVLTPCAELPLTERQALLQAVRRTMCADGRVRPLDRLTLMLVRHRLNGPAPLHRGGARDSNDLTGLPLALRQAIAELSAYLARLVPVADPHAVVGAAGAAWYRAVVQAVWGQSPNPPPCQVPASDTLVQVLRTIQELGWMRRPMLARAWLDAAQAVMTGSDSTPPGPVMSLEGAEALRIACGLLDTPMPPDLARHFNELPSQD